jgi:hypothetical protein
MPSDVLDIIIIIIIIVPGRADDCMRDWHCLLFPGLLCFQPALCWLLSWADEPGLVHALAEMHAWAEGSAAGAALAEMHAWAEGGSPHGAAEDLHWLLRSAKPRKDHQAQFCCQDVRGSLQFTWQVLPCIPRSVLLHVGAAHPARQPLALCLAALAAPARCRQVAEQGRSRQGPELCGRCSMLLLLQTRSLRACACG